MASAAAAPPLAPDTDDPDDTRTDPLAPPSADPDDTDAAPLDPLNE